LKKWAKNVKVVGENRFNSYTITLLLLHYLQCGVYPPVLPNLMKLFPEDYGGGNEPWELTTQVDKRRLPSLCFEIYLHVNNLQCLECQENQQMSVGALFCGFFRYYSQFDFHTHGILIKDAAVIDL
jgi:poly(A) RNA polymerase GLD2